MTILGEFKHAKNYIIGMHEGYNLLINVPRTTKEYLKSEYISTECFKMEGSFLFFRSGESEIVSWPR